MNLLKVTRQFQSEDDCLDYIEKARWPSEKCCIHCGSVNISQFSREAASKNKRTRLYQCLEKECGLQFSSTSGTIFDASHLPLTKWFMAIALIVEAKKGISAKQVARHLGMEKSYKTVWYLCHRIREAMKEGGMLTGVVEADETYMTPRRPRKGKPYVKKESRDVVLGMVERGGRLRLIPMKDAKMETIEPLLLEHVSRDAALQTDESAAYLLIGERNFPGRHRTINHSQSYGIGDLHTNTIENAFSLLKRGVYGTYHQVSLKHLGRYCGEFSYRFNRREEQAQLFDFTLKGLVSGKALRFRTLTAAE
jgi:transposase-like protein